MQNRGQVRCARSKHSSPARACPGSPARCGGGGWGHGKRGVKKGVEEEEEERDFVKEVLDKKKGLFPTLWRRRDVSSKF